MKKESKLNQHEERKARLDVTIEERCLQIFGINIAQKSKEEYTLEKKDGLLKLKIAYDRKKYKNAISSYSELLKEYFIKDKIYVLSRIKVRRGLTSMFATIFQNSQKSFLKEMDHFTPYYLIERSHEDILVTIDIDCLRIFELPSGDKTKFIFDGYRFKKANLLSLK